MTIGARKHIARAERKTTGAGQRRSCSLSYSDFTRLAVPMASTRLNVSAAVQRAVAVGVAGQTRLDRIDRVGNPLCQAERTVANRRDDDKRQSNDCGGQNHPVHRNGTRFIIVEPLQNS